MGGTRGLSVERRGDRPLLGGISRSARKTTSMDIAIRTPTAHGKWKATCSAWIPTAAPSSNSTGGRSAAACSNPRTPCPRGMCCRLTDGPIWPAPTATVGCASTSTASWSHPNPRPARSRCRTATCSSVSTATPSGFPIRCRTANGRPTTTCLSSMASRVSSTR